MVLNKVDETQNEGKTPTQLVTDLRYQMLAIKGEAMSEDGSSVNYSKVKAAAAFQKYCQMVKQLHFVDLATLSNDEKKAFLINLYNSMIIHAVISDLLPEKSASSTLARL